MAAQTVAEWILLPRAGHGIETEGEAKLSAQPGELSELLIFNWDRSDQHGQAKPDRAI
jgi:hypothetical protein